LCDLQDGSRAPQDHLGFYLLDGHEPVPTDDLAAWEMLLADEAARRVGQTTVGRFWVSTMFIGGPGRRLFETVVSDETGAVLEEQWSDTWAAAETMHAAVVEQVRASARNL
jgi:hypothetical protein